MTILLVIATIAFITSITGVMLHDFHAIKVERAYRHHPHARKWRQRPAVTVVGTDDTSALRRTYRKLRLSSTPAVDGLTLHLPHGATLPPRGLPQAMHFFALYPKKSLALLPVITTPTATRQLFLSTYLLLAAPFALMRSGLALPPHRDFPAVTHTTVHGNGFAAASWAVSIAALYAWSYGTYVALFLQQAELLLGLLVAFAAWSLWAIGRYPFLGFRQKMFFVALLPAALPYFVWRLATAPLRLPILLTVAYTRQWHYERHTNTTT